MNQKLLAERAKRLRAEIARASASLPEAADLGDALSDLLDEVDAGRVTTEVDWNDVPGEMLFQEGTLSQDRALESAYSNFKLQITGSEDD